MKITWHANMCQFRIEAPDGGLQSVPIRRFDRIQRCWWVPEICWWDLYRISAQLPLWEPWLIAYHGIRPTLGLPPIAGRLPEGSMPPLDFQLGSIAVLASGSRLLADDLGLGKTYSACLAYAHLNMLGKATGMVVICPKRKVQDWHDDFQRFLGRPARPRELLVANYERTFNRRLGGPLKPAKGLPGPEDMLAACRGGHVLVVDEIHLLQGLGSARYLSVQALARAAPYVWGLTGTPISNRPDSFLPVYKLITGAQADLPSFYQKFATLDRYGSPVKWKPCVVELRGVFGRIGIRHTREEVLTLPPQTIRAAYVPLEGRQAELYRQVKATARGILYPPGGGKRQLTIRKDEVLPFFTRLLQICNDPRLLGDDADERHLAKWKVIDELLDEAGEQKVLLWDEHPATLERFHARYSSRLPALLHGSRKDADNEADKYRFLNDPSCQLCCISLLAFGEGLNLQAAAVSIFHGLTWRYEKLYQAMGRIRRIGQDRPQTQYIVLAQHTLEEYMFERLRQKDTEARLIQGDRSGWDIDRMSWDELRGMLR